MRSPTGHAFEVAAGEKASSQECQWAEFGCINYVRGRTVSLTWKVRLESVYKVSVKNVLSWALGDVSFF